MTVQVAPTVVVPDEFGPIQQARIDRAVQEHVRAAVSAALGFRRN